MRTCRKSALASFLVGAAALTALALFARADAPHGWFLAGTKPAEYEVKLDTAAAREGHPSACLKDKNGNTGGFGTLMQEIQAIQYLEKRVRLTGYVKSVDVRSWAGLWMRVDKGTNMVSFDNMQDRAIKGSTDWRQYDVVLDVPKDATGIAFGILLDGPGSVWLSGTKFEVVSSDVPVTGAMRGEHPTAPVNLDFSEN
jgi:hypothetical protein